MQKEGENLSWLIQQKIPFPLATNFSLFLSLKPSLWSLFSLMSVDVCYFSTFSFYTFSQFIIPTGILLLVVGCATLVALTFFWLFFYPLIYVSSAISLFTKERSFFSFIYIFIFCVDPIIWVEPPNRKTGIRVWFGIFLCLVCWLWKSLQSRW